MFRLDHKIALVTGSGSGIGREIALLYAQQGAHVLVADIQLEAAQAVVGEIQARAGQAQAIQIDIANEEQVATVFAQVVQEHGRLDILVNNAGVSHVGNILETTLTDWKRVMGINAAGTFLCAREAVKHMVAQEPQGGVIVNIASVAGMIGIERRLPYSASKGAVISITRSVAMDFVQQNIRVNAICPGTVHTPFVDGYLARSFADTKDEELAKLHARQPIGRMGRPEEIASAALYLASDEAAFVTGSALVIDGGWTAK
ncbi:SDR family NAD(P)-dependent oxidoreductase [Dictyobacter arantiisoli]|uniref:Putative oxidoreductase n=1 Tax=Dictyobacter arantiisoli TaxID=2014874 RepID=A0A5A5TJ75_9CHLR|nr:glucose 1-dehydrogenase [Dictyobacter arantiisoli]GCF11660.1 putative oxidoreductase [Dictyobacter arantiisoli]